MKAASAGLGDGTVYISGAAAVASQSGKTFDLTPMTKIADLPALTDDVVNSHLLYFPSSGNRYTILDFVASTEVVTVLETPDTADTGSWEVRRTLVDVNALASNPVKNLADGQRFSLWKSIAITTIDINLPNALDNGGFESGAIGPWLFSTSGGTADTSGVNSASPVLGGFDFKLDPGDRASLLLRQTLNKFTLKRGRKYRIAFKGRVTAGTFTNNLTVVFVDFNSFTSVAWSNLSSGSSDGLSWFPGLTSANTWHTASFVPTVEDMSVGDFQIYFQILPWSGAGFVHVDEIYIWEEVNVNALVIYDGIAPILFSGLRGRNVARDRSGQVSEVDNFSISTLGSATASKYIIKEITGGVYPIYSIGLNNLRRSSQILLSEKWAWQFNPDMPFDAEEREYDEKTVRSRSGVERTIRHSKARLMGGTYSQMPTVDRDILMNSFFPHHIDDERHPFAYRLNATDRPLFVRVDRAKFGTPRTRGTKDDFQFKFKEVL